MILILGYGNPLRGDDALGFIAGEFLSRHYHDAPLVQVETVHQLTPELAEKLAAYDTVILIDAHHQEPAGQVFSEIVRPATCSTPHTFSHYVSPADLLLLVHRLYGSYPRMFLTGITTSSFAVGEPLSLPVLASMPILYEEVMSLAEKKQCATGG